MSIGASTKIINRTGHVIKFTSITKVNTDDTFDFTPEIETHIPDGSSCLIAMGNNSFPPKGVGFRGTFHCYGIDAHGGMLFDNPAVGKHTFTFYTEDTFEYTKSDLKGNSYEVIVTLA